MTNPRFEIARGEPVCYTVTQIIRINYLGHVGSHTVDTFHVVHMVFADPQTCQLPNSAAGESSQTDSNSACYKV